MVSLRKLQEEDAPYMLEWMHDPNVVRWLGKNFMGKKIDDCINFIHESEGEDGNVNLAIVDQNDIYQGTVSLKHISKRHKNAEFAIVMRSEAMGKGYAQYAISKIIEYGFRELQLSSIYWSVSTSNERAIKFYEKNLFSKIRYDDISIDANIKLSQEWYTDEQLKNLYWYCISI